MVQVIDLRPSAIDSSRLGLGRDACSGKKTDLLRRADGNAGKAILYAAFPQASHGRLIIGVDRQHVVGRDAGLVSSQDCRSTAGSNDSRHVARFGHAPATTRFGQGRGIEYQCREAR